VLDGRILIALTPGILLEYEEQISKHWNSTIALNVVRSLTELPSSRFVTVYYNLELITADPDDNKFIDCAFASNADFIISNDSHFAVLKNINFPSIPVLKIDGFEQLLKKENII